MASLLRKFRHQGGAGAAAGEEKSSRDLAVKPGGLQIVANQGEQFHGARLDDVREHVREDGAWGTVAYAGNLDRAVSLHECGSSAAVAALESFGFRDRSTQANSEIIRKMIAANSNRAGVTHHAAAKDKQFRGAAADVQKAAAKIALVLREARFRGSQRLKDSIGDKDAGLVGAGDEILGGGNGGSHQMDVYFQTRAEHADGVAYAALRIDNKLMRKDVQDFAIFWKRDVASSINGAADVFALDVSRPVSQSDTAAAVYAAYVAA